MDMIFRDDECRVRTNHAPANFITLKHMAHNLIRKGPGGAKLPPGTTSSSFARFLWICCSISSSTRSLIDI
jgi:hypothetical protein